MIKSIFRVPDAFHDFCEKAKFLRIYFLLQYQYKKRQTLLYYTVELGIWQLIYAAKTRSIFFES